jgi:hypothetical protein
MASHARTLSRTLPYEDQPNSIARQLDFCFHPAECTKTRWEYLWFLALKLLPGHSNRAWLSVTNNNHEQSCSVLTSKDNLAVSPLPFVSLVYTTLHREFYTCTSTRPIPILALLFKSPQKTAPSYIPIWSIHFSPIPMSIKRTKTSVRPALITNQTHIWLTLSDTRRLQLFLSLWTILLQQIRLR